MTRKVLIDGASKPASHEIVLVAPATLGELLDCQRELEPNGNGEARFRVAEFIAHMRQETEPQPIAIQIVNAREIGATEKILSVHGDRFRVLNGGQYANVEVILKDLTSKVTEHWDENKTGWRTKYMQEGEAYVALQWYSDGQPISTVAKMIGTLNPGRPRSVALSALIGEGERSRGAPSFQVWSGANELKTTQVEKPEW